MRKNKLSPATQRFLEESITWGDCSNESVVSNEFQQPFAERGKQVVTSVVVVSIEIRLWLLEAHPRTADS